MMFNFDSYFAAVCTVLRETDENAALDLLGLSPESRAAGTVQLIEGECTLGEALSYARVLYDLGRDAIAAELVLDVMRAGFEPANRPFVMPLTAVS